MKPLLSTICLVLMNYQSLLGYNNALMVNVHSPSVALVHLRRDDMSIDGAVLYLSYQCNLSFIEAYLQSSMRQTVD